MRSLLGLALGLLMVGTCGAAEPAAEKLPPLNELVFTWAQRHLGKQVGNGECWTLADKALQYAKADHPDTYVFGRALGAGEAARVGDVIQFSSVRLEKGGGFLVLGAPNHTAIIAKVVGPGVYGLLHQNFGVRKVTELTVDLAGKTAGEVVIYRPVPAKE